MEQNIPIKPTPIEIIESQLRECYARVVWTHKTQEKCADIVLKIHKRVKLFEIILSATTTTSLLVSVFGESKIGTMVATVLSTALFALTTYTKDYDLGEIAQKHTNCANKLWNVRESYLSVLTDIKANNIDMEKIQQKRDELQGELSNIYTGSPRTNSKAYIQASAALQKNEEFTFSDDEIDMFLPKNLRKIN